MTISLWPEAWDSQPRQVQRPEGTRGLSSAPSSSTGKVHPAHSGCPPKYCQHTQIRNPRPMRLGCNAWFGIWRCAREGASKGRGHAAWWVHPLRHSWKDIKEPFLLQIFPFCWMLPFFCYCSPFPFTFLVSNIFCFFLPTKAGSILPPTVELHSWVISPCCRQQVTLLTPPLSRALVFSPEEGEFKLS